MDFNIKHKNNMKVLTSIEVPTKTTDINLVQLESFAKLSLLLEQSEQGLLPLLHPSEKTDESDAIRKASATYISDLTNISSDKVLKLNAETLNLIQMHLNTLVQDISFELQQAKDKSEFTVKKPILETPQKGRSKITFFISGNIIQHYPAIVYTKATELAEIYMKNPIQGLARIRELIAWVIYIKPKGHEFNNLFTKDLHNDVIYDTNKLNQRKQLISNVSAKDGLRLCNFFLRKLMRRYIIREYYLRPQMKSKESRQGIE